MVTRQSLVSSVFSYYVIVPALGPLVGSCYQKLFSHLFLASFPSPFFSFSNKAWEQDFILGMRLHTGNKTSYWE